MTQGPKDPELVVVPAQSDEQPADSGHADIEHPAKVMRIATMARSLLDELRVAPMDEASRARMREIYETSIHELGEVLADELRDELKRLSLPFDEDTPSDAELRVAHAQLVGWLEGLFHGIQAMLVAQQMENQARLQEMRRRVLPRGPGENPQPGQYL